jgi:hypothetical protein
MGQIDNKERNRMKLNLTKMLTGANLKKNKEHWSKRKAITIWVSPEQKEAYDRLQETSGSRFGKIIQIIVRDVIDEANRT